MTQEELTSFPDAPSFHAWVAWSVVEPTELKKRIRLARTAVGTGIHERQLERLMVWVAATLKHTAEHSLIVEPWGILGEGTAWCDQMCRVFCWLAWHFCRVETRIISVHHIDKHEGHTMVEACYRNRWSGSDTWHLFDVDSDHCTTYTRYSGGRFLSYEQLVADPAPILAKRHWWRYDVLNRKKGMLGFFLQDCKMNTYAGEHTKSWPWPTYPTE